jgi:hypothetical protein
VPRVLRSNDANPSNTAILLAFIASLPLAAADSNDKPNIVLIVMDNFGYGEIGVYSGGELRDGYVRQMAFG